MPGTAVEQVQAQDLQARQVLNRTLATADVMAASNLVRADLRGKVEDVRAIAITLHQYGLPPGIRNINACFVVNGRVEFMTGLWTGLAVRHGHRVWVCDADPRKCSCSAPSSDTEGRAHIIRVGDEDYYTAAFSWEDAKRAGLTDSQTYKKYPTDMLSWRALSRVIKRYAPEIMAGLADVDDEPVARPRPRPVPSAVVPDEDDDITDAELVENDAGPEIAAAPPGPAVDGAEQTAVQAAGDRDNVAGEPVVGPAAAPGRACREIAKQHGASAAGVLRKARECAVARGLPEPLSMDEPLAEQVEADLIDSLGE